MQNSDLKIDAGAGERRNADAIESSRRAYRLFAPLYDFVFGLSLRHGRKLAIAALDPKPGERILEVGIGSGISLPLYPAGVSLIGIDISEEMLLKARKRVARKHSARNHTLLRMDVENLSFVDASFDKAVVMYAVSGFPRPAIAMREIKRVCKAGATIVVVNRFLSRKPLMRFFDILLAPLYRLLRYRADVDADELLAASDLELIDATPANLFGYSTVLVCRNRAARRSNPGAELATIDLAEMESSART